MLFTSVLHRNLKFILKLGIYDPIYDPSLITTEYIGFSFIFFLLNLKSFSYKAVPEWLTRQVGLLITELLIANFSSLSVLKSKSRKSQNRGNLNKKMKPLQHALITAYHYGGDWQDWYAYHDWFDRSKKSFASMQHRFFLHSDFGCALTRQLLGVTLVATSDSSVTVPTQELVEDHQVEDLGRVIPLTEWRNLLDDASLIQAEKEALIRQTEAEQ